MAKLRAVRTPLFVDRMTMRFGASHVCRPRACDASGALWGNRTTVTGPHSPFALNHSLSIAKNATAQQSHHEERSQRQSEKEATRTRSHKSMSHPTPPFLYLSFLKNPSKRSSTLTWGNQMLYQLTRSRRPSLTFANKSIPRHDLG